MSSMINDKQREAFKGLVSMRLPELIEQSSMEIGDSYALSFRPFPVVMSDCISKDGTDYVVVRTECALEDMVSGEKVTFNVDLLRLPVFNELGFKIKGNYMQLLDSYDRVPGWHFTLDKAGTTKFRNTASAVSTGGKSFAFVYDGKEKLYASFKLTSKQNKKIDVSASTFLRAVTGMSSDELLVKFGFDNPFVMKAFNDSTDNRIEPDSFHLITRNDCIDALAHAVLGKSVAESDSFSSVFVRQRELEKQLFSPRYFTFGMYNRERMEYLQSFQSRALGKILAETVEVAGTTLQEGIILSNMDLRMLDASDVSSIKVKYNGKTYTLNKFSTLTFRALGMKLAEAIPDCSVKVGKVLTIADLDEINRLEIDSLRVTDPKTHREIVLTRQKNTGALTKDDLLTAFGIWVNNLNGFDAYDHTYDLTNRMMVPFDTKVLNMVQNHLDFVVEDLTEKLKMGDSMTSLLSAVADYSAKIDLDAFINYVSASDTNTGQISDMCNVMSFASKNYKAASDIGGHIPDELVNVQNLQNGRIDPFDVPESNKIALVYHRTLLSKLNDDGYLTAPYLRVENGEVVSSEPVYLTAVEESDKYIAEWNETFRNEDGSLKMTVRARYNGDVVMTKLSNVFYKCYSPYQAMSAAHSTIVFPGHSDGKRITMGCNQITQAVPLVSGERPYVNGGGESLLNYGFYYAKDVLSDYVATTLAAYPELEAYKGELLVSSIQLKQMQALGNQRTLTFDVLAAGEVSRKSGVQFPATSELTFPYLMGNFELGMFSYNIAHKPDGIYTPNEVVAYSNSCSIENPEHLDCVDTGMHDVDTGVFDKGLALVKNLVVGYKTFEGSTMDDAITISDELLYGDDLTSITIHRITEPLHKDDRAEVFGIKNDIPYRYFGTNGLPLIGSVLHPCDPVVSKITCSGSAHYKFLKPYQQGQVVSAEIKIKNNERFAEVMLAERSTIEVGDKMAGRCGNKGVIAKIVPAEQMPYDPVTGLRLQIVLNPLGIPSRQNISQLLEVPLAMCLKMDAKISYVSPYNEKDVDFVREQADGHGVHPAVFVDGRTGRPFERPINYGVISMYKLHHMAAKKIHAIGLETPVDPVFLQPRKGSKFEGGQSFGEMESWCLECIGAKRVLQDLYSVQSNDVAGKAEMRESLEDGRHIQSSGGVNHNDASMQCCYRALGVDFVTNVEEGTYEFVPLTDDTIRSFSPYPVTDRFALHNPNIFGSMNNLVNRDASRYKWGWIDLQTEIIHPIWIEKGSLHKFIVLHSKEGKVFARRQDLKAMINGTLYLCKLPEHENDSAFFVASTEKDSIFFPYDELTDIRKETAITGMQALVEIFKTADTEYAESLLGDMLLNRLSKCPDCEYVGNNNVNPSIEEIVSSYKFKCGRVPESIMSLLKAYRDTVTFNRSGYGLADYVNSAYPVVPQIYRPEFEGTGGLTVPDFDWHYRQIMQAAENVSRSKNAASEFQLYERIRIFSGIGDAGTKKDQKYQNILSYFGGKNKKNHGKIRQNVQSKRIYCSGRAPIIPAGNVKMKPTEIGIPFTMLVKMYESPLIGLLKDYECGECDISSAAWAKLLMYVALRRRNLFEKFYGQNFMNVFSWDSASAAYDGLTSLITAYLEGRDGFSKQVVIAGRQPSLHKYAIRAYYPLVVYDKAIHVHTLVCAGYNADFDGDQMWVAALMSQDAKEEAIELMSPKCDCINPKNSSVVLEHTQDTLLGVYCATMLKDNTDTPSYDVGDVHYYSSLEEMTLELDTGGIHSYDLVSIVAPNGRSYLSTAGRVLFNQIVGGFTEHPFTNTIGISGIGPKSEYSELQYDGIVASGKAKSGKIRYYRLQDICKDLYLSDADNCVYIYQQITEFGFKYSDTFAVSISLEDLDIASNKDEMLKEAERLKTAIESDCQDGLISEEDRKEAIIALYNDNETGIHGIVQKDMISHLDRNSNLFIMLDSGARGSEGQVMRMSGFLPQLQKDKFTTLETPITSNFYKGLSDFDVHMTSYSVRTGLASTQNETPKAGYATHQVVFMTGGVEIVENDCGKTDWGFDILWGDHLADRDRFLPSLEWFNKNLLGRVIAFDDDKARELFGTGEDGVISKNAYACLSMNQGFHSVRFSDNTEYTVSVMDLLNKTLLKSDYKSMRVLGRMLDNGHITNNCIHVIERQHLHEVGTSAGYYYFHYSIDECCKSLLLYRVVRSGTLPYTQKAYDNEGNTVEIITQETLRYVEEKDICRVQARVLLDCKSVHGICACCYGLKYSNLKFPVIGEYVGTEAAQAIGEPSAQLTISLVNKGGTAGASINSGVAKFDALLKGSLPGGRSAGNAAIVAPWSGYVRIKPLDKMAVVAIEPINKINELCKKCVEQSGMPVQSGSEAGSCRNRILFGEPCCIFDFRIKKSDIIPLDGEWVNAGDPITNLTVLPDSIKCVGIEGKDHSVHDSYKNSEVLRKKQMVWLLNYFNTFSENSILINARHFEILARIQNGYAVVTRSENPDFKVGSTYEISEVCQHEDEVDYVMAVSRRDEVILRTSGPMTALAFERLTDVAASLVNKCYKGSNKHNNALIGAVSAGANLVTGEIKQFNRPEFRKYKTAEDHSTKRDSIISFDQAVMANDSFNEISVSMDSLDFGSLAQELENLSAFGSTDTADSTTAYTPQSVEKVSSEFAAESVDDVHRLDAFTGDTLAEDTIAVNLVNGLNDWTESDYETEDDGVNEFAEYEVEDQSSDFIDAEPEIFAGEGYSVSVEKQTVNANRLSAF